ncbi:hypothetical protein OF829_10820 [Sphingomonas sp. LB-2]|uniref:hypothetical protein n=1 Tax=Sphingomonas caeni TaxID=2984949 RepID=UPI00223031C5|nr:hypothetical protein [Sphingomonas caeni]MCW3847733.1 hypothetical protein [Sphingomonas caeni]
MTHPVTPPRTPKPRPRRLKAAGVAFIPVPSTRKRHDGWTPQRQKTFLAALYACGSVATAAKAVGMSPRTAYRLRTRPGAESFAAAWDKLLREARARAFDMVVEAALTDSFVPRTYRGLFTGAVTANNRHMLLAALRAGGRRPGAPASQQDALFPSGKGHQ